MIKHRDIRQLKQILLMRKIVAYLVVLKYLGRLIKETDPEGKIIVYAYDASGNLISKMDATGIASNYVYDSLNRLTGIVFPDTTQNISYTYDSTGKVLTMTDQSGMTSYVYGTSNRLISEIKTIEGKTFNVSYNYSLTGALTSITYPSGRIVSYEYDPTGKIIEVIEQKDGKSQEIISNIAYQTNGLVSSIIYGNGIVTAKGYDVKGMLNSLNIGNLKQLTYTRDNVGNITAINDLLDPTKTKTYAYDALYRLTQAVGSWGTIQYNYDPTGNRTTEISSSGTTNYSYSANKLISSTGAKAFSFNYDANGNTVAENNKQYIYNQNQRLIRAVENGQTLGEYLYNANGQRVKKIVNGRTTYFVYDQSGNLIEEADEQGQVNGDYIYLGSLPIARADEWWEGMKLPQAPEVINLIPGDRQLTVSWNESHAPLDGYKVYWGTATGNYTNSIDVGKTNSYTITELTNGTTYYVAVKSYADIKETYFYHTDHLGTPILMTNGSATIVWEGELLPFGERYSVKGNVINNLGLPGQYYDIETGQYYNWWRYYNADIGRYKSFDPILHPANGPPSSKACSKVTSYPSIESLKLNPQKLNPYVYVNNPINKIDPSGLLAVGTVDGYLQSCYKFPNGGDRCNCYCQIATDFEGCLKLCNNCFSGKNPFTPYEACMCLCKSAEVDTKLCKCACKQVGGSK